ncbi:unnamed protein product [Thlaspi arvense]|uniref:Uncharacterized protein n=1 Tax=Thlaspi arvense TaxID=13288 RepID=A0AAU9R969_THLAR|nr:unnamed protein product [Thlaspi arvense]
MDKDKGEDAEGIITSLEEYRKGVEEMQLEVTRTFANFEARLEPKMSGLAQAVEKTKKETLEAIKSMFAEFQARRDSEMRESAETALGSTKAGREI